MNAFIGLVRIFLVVDKIWLVCGTWEGLSYFLQMRNERNSGVIFSDYDLLFVLFLYIPLWNEIVYRCYLSTYAMSLAY